MFVEFSSEKPNVELLVIDEEDEKKEGQENEYERTCERSN